MARKRLTPANPNFLETKQATPRPAAPPIAQVAGEAAAMGALQELSDDVARARAEGRMIVEVPLSDIAPDHLARDRVAHDDAEMRSLMKSIFDHGQRTPIEVTEIDGAHKYGLISGWRRLTALEKLKAQTGDVRFDTVLALIRRPKDAADAYVSMVEENEIRVGLSYYERARVATEAVKRGVFETEKAALLSLFASASRAKRSRIRSFVELYHALDGHLVFPAAIPERLGLAVVDALRADAGNGEMFRAKLAQAQVQSAEAETELLAKLARPLRPKSDVPRAEHPKETLPNGLKLVFKGNRIEITGKPLSQDIYRQVVQALGQIPTSKP